MSNSSQPVVPVVIPSFFHPRNNLKNLYPKNKSENGNEKQNEKDIIKENVNERHHSAGRDNFFTIYLFLCSFIFMPISLFICLFIILFLLLFIFGHHF